MKSSLRSFLVGPVLLGLCLVPGNLLAGGANAFLQTDLVSDIPGAASLDPSLRNPWGLTYGGTGPLWVADNGTGVSTLYNGTGVKQGLVVTIPPGGANPTSEPSGIVFNPLTGFALDRGGHALFIFATEEGTIAGWNGALGTTAEIKVNNSAAAASYKGLAIGNNGVGDFLYAANFHDGTIDVFNSSFAATTLAGSFTDPTLPSGYAPFNIQKLGNELYVTYALQDAGKADDVAGAGNGYVDVFDLNGNLLRRFASQGALNSPWGLAIAPAGFGPFGGDVLVGNFGDGSINVFDSITGNFLAALDDTGGNPIMIDGLRGLEFGNGGNGGSTDALYFTAGIAGEDAKQDHGLFGNIVSAVPEADTALPVAFGICALGVAQWLRMRAAAAVPRPRSH